MTLQKGCLLMMIQNKIFFSASDSDSSEGVSSEDSSSEEIGADNIHSGTSITQATRGRGL